LSSLKPIILTQPPDDNRHAASDDKNSDRDQEADQSSTFLLPLLSFKPGGSLIIVAVSYLILKQKEKRRS
jgi:hypothetical protein